MSHPKPQSEQPREFPHRFGRASIVWFEEGLVIKSSDEVRSSQSAAMEYVRDHAPSVPVPTVHGTHFSNPRKGYIFMDEIPGDTLEVVWPSLSPSQKEDVCKEIWDMVMTLRRLPRPGNLPPPDTFYTTVDGSPTYNHGLLGLEFAPVPEELLESDETFRSSILQRYRERHGSDQDVLLNFPRSEAAVFTHGDIKPRNSMVSEDGHINSLLDWEYSGFMPDYWEATGMLMLVRTGEEEWVEVMERTKPGEWDYDLTQLGKAQCILTW